MLIFSVSFNKSFSLSSGSKIKPATMITTIIAKETDIFDHINLDLTLIGLRQILVANR